MRDSSLAIAGLLLSATLLSGFAKIPSKALFRTRTVTGHAIDAGTAKELANVDVVASGHSIGVRTKNNGEFQLNDVPDGATQIQLRHPCFFSVHVTIPASGDVELDVGLPFDRSSLQRAGCGGLGARKK